MKITYEHTEFQPELTLSGPEMVRNGFAPDTPIRVMLQDNALWVTPVNEAMWHELLNSPDADVAADVVGENGSITLAGGWLTSLGITDNTNIEVGFCEGVIRIRVPRNWH